MRKAKAASLEQSVRTSLWCHFLSSSSFLSLTQSWNYEMDHVRCKNVDSPKRETVWIEVGCCLKQKNVESTHNNADNDADWHVNQQGKENHSQDQVLLEELDWKKTWQFRIRRKNNWTTVSLNKIRCGFHSSLGCCAVFVLCRTDFCGHIVIHGCCWQQTNRLFYRSLRAMQDIFTYQLHFCPV